MSNSVDAEGAGEAERNVNTPKGPDSLQPGTWAYS